MHGPTTKQHLEEPFPLRFRRVGLGTSLEARLAWKHGFAWQGSPFPSPSTDDRGTPGGIDPRLTHLRRLDQLSRASGRLVRSVGSNKLARKEV